MAKKKTFSPLVEEAGDSSALPSGNSELVSNLEKHLAGRSLTDTVQMAAEMELSVQELRQVLKSNAQFVVNENDQWIVIEVPSQNSLELQSTSVKEPLTPSETNLSSSLPLESPMDSNSRQDAKQAVQANAEVMNDAVLLSSRIIQDLLRRWNESQKPQQNQQASSTQTAAESSPQVEIKRGDEVLFRGKENQEPEINKLNEHPQLVEALSSALKLPPDSQATRSDDQKIRVTIDNQEVLKLDEKGNIEKNLLVSEPNQQNSPDRGLSAELNQAGDSLKQSVTEALGEEQRLYVSGSEPSEAFKAERGHDGKLQVERTLVNDGEIDRSLVLETNEQGEITTFVPEHAVEANEAFQSPAQTQTQSQSNSIESFSQVKLSEGDRIRLSDQGIDPNQIEQAANQAMQAQPQQKAQGGETHKAQQAQVVPVVVILERQVNKLQPNPIKENLKKMVEGIKNLPRQIQQVAQKNAQAVTQKIGEAATTFKQTFRKVNPLSSNRPYKQDLSNLAALQTASQLINQYGKSNGNDEKRFEVGTYQFTQKGNDIAINAKDGRGTILNLQGGKLTGNLSKTDSKQFRQVARKLTQVATAQQSMAQQRRSLELSR